MSTAGKVLVVLVTLALMGWIVLFSAVAQRNTNWGKSLQALEVKAEDVAKKADAQEISLEKTKVDTTLIRSRQEKDAVVLRGRLSDAEKELSLANETNSRYKIDREAVDAAAEDANATRERWEADVAALKRQLADVQAVVGKFKAENAALAGTYGGLQGEFIKVKGETDQAAKSSVKPRTR